MFILHAFTWQYITYTHDLVRKLLSCFCFSCKRDKQFPRLKGIWRGPVPRSRVLYTHIHTFICIYIHIIYIFTYLCESYNFCISVSSRYDKRLNKLKCFASYFIISLRQTWRYRNDFIGLLSSKQHILTAILTYVRQRDVQTNIAPHNLTPYLHRKKCWGAELTIQSWNRVAR